MLGLSIKYVSFLSAPWFPFGELLCWWGVILVPSSVLIVYLRSLKDSPEALPTQSFLSSQCADMRWPCDLSSVNQNFSPGSWNRAKWSKDNKSSRMVHKEDSLTFSFVGVSNHSYEDSLSGHLPFQLLTTKEVEHYYFLPLGNKCFPS